MGFGSFAWSYVGIVCLRSGCPVFFVLMAVKLISVFWGCGSGVGCVDAVGMYTSGCVCSAVSYRGKVLSFFFIFMESSSRSVLVAFGPASELG